MGTGWETNKENRANQGQFTGAADNAAVPNAIIAKDALGQGRIFG
jgi:hypothetical protein